MLSVVMLNVICAECCKKAHYAECRYAECRDTVNMPKIYKFTAVNAKFYSH
jgi:hypothetical protein